MLLSLKAKLINCSYLVKAKYNIATKVLKQIQKIELPKFITPPFTNHSSRCFYQCFSSVNNYKWYTIFYRTCVI